MNVLALFDGISVGREALEKLGIVVDNYFSCEINPDSILITQKNYPKNIQVGDILDLEFEDGLFLYKGNKYRIDLVLAGPPCQGFSDSGKLLNFEDPRSKLFLNFVDIKNKLLPCYFLAENVDMKKEWILRINNLLGVEGTFINSEIISAHNRMRWYWTNINFELPVRNNINFKDIVENPKNLKILYKKGKLKKGEIPSPLSDWDNETILVDRDKALCVTKSYYKGGNVEAYLSKNRKQLVFTVHKNGSSKKHSKKVVDSQIVKDFCTNLGITLDQLDYRLLTPIECERLQGLPDNYTEGVCVTKRLQLIGDSWSSGVIIHLLRGLEGV